MIITGPATHETWEIVATIWLLVAAVTIVFLFRLPTFESLRRSTITKSLSEKSPWYYKIPSPIIIFSAFVSVLAVLALIQLGRNQVRFEQLVRSLSYVIVWLRDGEIAAPFIVDWAPVWSGFFVLVIFKVGFSLLSFLCNEILNRFHPDYLHYQSRHFLIGRPRKHLEKERRSKRAQNKLTAIQGTIYALSFTIFFLLGFTDILIKSEVVTGGCVAFLSVIIVLIKRSVSEQKSNKQLLKEIEEQFDEKKLAVEYRRITARKFLFYWLLLVPLTLLVVSMVRFHTLTDEGINTHDWKFVSLIPWSAVRSLQLELKPPTSDSKREIRGPGDLRPVLDVIVKSSSSDLDFNVGGSLSLDARRVLEIIHVFFGRGISVDCTHNEAATKAVEEFATADKKDRYSFSIDLYRKIARSCAGELIPQP